MKAVAYTDNTLPIEDPAALVDVDLPAPQPGPRDLLVEVRAVAVNPVDTKVRKRAAVSEPAVLGWDASGVVREAGAEVSLFRPGDEVFYAGSITRPGCFSELHVVDERIVGHKPRSLDHARAAALPLTTITAWELLFDRLGVPEGGGDGEHLLVIGGAGGVGSMLIQLARRLTRLNVIATASRPETRAWVESLGAHHVVDHTLPLPEELARIGIPEVGYVASLTQTDTHYPGIVAAMRAQGRMAVIDDPSVLDVMPMKRKALSLHWEFMFARPMFDTPDLIRQHELLERVAGLVDEGVVQTTFGEHYGTIDAANLRRAFALIESGRARGKLVLEGFDEV